MKKLLAMVLLLATLLACASTMVACLTNDDSIEEDPGKTNISVATYNGGIGKEWLEAAARRFEEKYANVSFEEGKTGVKVSVSTCENATILEGQRLSHNVYFTELFDYNTWVNSGKVADISDVVTGSLSEFGEEGTIEQKLDAQFVNFLKANNGSYYALPFYDGFVGLIYDRDWFAEREYFFAKDGGFTGDENNLSAGPDGVSGNWDDGMPATYDDLRTLIEKIRADKGVPLLYGEGNAMDYWLKIMTGWWANYEGKESMLKNWELDGTFDIATSVNGNNVTKGSVTLTAENVATMYKELQKQAGKYYALKLLDDVICADANNTAGTNYLEAQGFLINTGVYSQMKNRYAMLLDGVWWENEADLGNKFNLAAQNDADYMGNPADYKNTRRFAMMPAPRAYGQSAENYRQTLFSDSESFCFVSSSTTGAKLDVSKRFLQFLHTDAELSAFTAKTSVPRCFHYSVSDADLSTMTYFGKQIIEMKKASDVVYPYSGNEYYTRHSGDFTIRNWGWKATVDDLTRSNPFTEISKGMTAKEYFDGLYKEHNK